MQIIYIFIYLYIYLSVCPISAEVCTFLNRRSKIIIDYFKIQQFNPYSACLQLTLTHDSKMTDFSRLPTIKYLPECMIPFIFVKCQLSTVNRVILELGYLVV